MVSSLPTQVIPEEETSNRVLNTARHFHHVLHNFLHWGILNSHVDSADGDHKIEPWDDVACVLDELVKVCKVINRMGVAEIDRKVAERIEDSHVQFVVLLGA